MPHSPYKSRPRARFSEPHRHPARASFPAPAAQAKWGGNGGFAGARAPPHDAWESDDEGRVEGAGDGESDTEAGWSSGTDWSDESPAFEPAQGKPLVASAHALAGLRSVKHASLFNAITDPAFAFDARAAHALDASKTLLRFMAETAPAHFTPYLDKLAALQISCASALSTQQSALVGPAAAAKAKRAAELVAHLRALQAQEGANHAQAMEDLRAIRKETEAALAAAAEKYDAEREKLGAELKGVFPDSRAKKKAKATGTGKKPAARKRR
ncbi:hypothetical protein JCM10450v2_001681 [Rhodotorula kratochvilovae]